MREVYERPEMEVVYFEAEDIITESGEDNPAPVDDYGWG